jgi:serine/threonine protein kinase/tetratricopeptide (TPR) repeat protein
VDLFRRPGVNEPTPRPGHLHTPDFLDLLHDLLPPDPATARRLRQAAAALPEAGTTFQGFTLVRELGRGTFGRVFLARQPDVADRPVVVKVAADVGGEVRVLAQLRHTNVVPVYSVHAAGPLQVVCMPFLGERTLADVVLGTQTRGALPASGAELALLCRGSDTAPGLPAYPALEQLQALSYVDAIVWLAGRLAEGLAYAHAHGIVHCDLKPANVLLTASGEPMLLDFNVADDTKGRAGAAVAVAGGSLPYMAPEQLAVFSGRPAAVDARCDLYSFGVLLYELLTGRSPFAVPGECDPAFFARACQDRTAPPPRLRDHNPAVPPALEAIVRRCLEPDPDRRYPSAAALLEDLRCQRDHRPLRHAGNPSARERLAKFARRHPGLTSATGVAALAAGLLVAVAGLALAYRQRVAESDARAAAVAAWEVFRADARAAQFRLLARPGESEPLRQGEALARTALGRYGALDRPDWADEPLVTALPAAERDQLRDTAGELLLLLARAEALPAAGDTPADRRTRLDEAWRLNALAEACAPELADGPGLWAQRADLAAARGDGAAAADCRARAAALPLHTARDHYWRASELVAQGRLRAALPLLDEATRREPRNFWAWLLLGNVHYGQGQLARAEAGYDVGIALWPEFPWVWFNRGLARLQQKDYARAARDFDRCLELRPDAAEAHVNRALAEQGGGRLDAAERDLTRALELGAAESRLYFLRGRVRAQRGDTAGAAADRAEGLRREPADEKSWLARGLARMGCDPEAALADFTQALRANPRSAAALQNQAHVLAERLRRTEEALTALDRAVELLPESGELRCSRGVLLARLGRRDAAHRDARDALVRDPGPARRYQAACVYALTARDHPGDGTQALHLLAGALRDGYGHDLLAADADLDALRGDSEFRRLAAAAAALRPTNDASPKCR